MLYKILNSSLLIALASLSLNASEMATSPKALLCHTFMNEYQDSINSQLKIAVNSDFCLQNENSIEYTSKPMPGSEIEKIDLVVMLEEKKINCELDRIISSKTGFSHVPTYQTNQAFHFPAGGKGCQVTETINGTKKTAQLIKKYAKFNGLPLKDIIGTNENLTSYYPNNIDIKVPYPNGGSLYTPFAFTGVATTIYSTADKKSLESMLFLSGMAPVIVKENGHERALVLLIIFNFHNSGVGPYTEFQIAPLVQPNIQGQLLPPFRSVSDFVAGIDTKPGKGISKSFNGKLSVWQNHLFISSYESAFAELAIKGGRGVSYPKFLAQQQQSVSGRKLTTWVSQPQTAVGDEFEFSLNINFPSDIASIKFEQHLDQSLVHSNLSPTTNRWNTVVVQSNSKDSTVFATDFEPRGILAFNGQGEIAKRLNAMQLKPVMAQLSVDLKGATWTTKRDAGPMYYDESSFMNPTLKK